MRLTGAKRAHGHGMARTGRIHRYSDTAIYDKREIIRNASLCLYYVLASVVGALAERDWSFVIMPAE